MKYKGLVWVGSLASIFLFLPSLAIKLWEFISEAPWRQKSWFVYLLLFIILFQTVRVRRRIRKSGTHMNSHDSLIFLAKKRLVEGELSIEEFRQIREELKRS
jgi:hypothetical protein